MKNSNSKVIWCQLVFLSLSFLFLSAKVFFSNTGFLNFEGSFFELARQIRVGFTTMSPLKSVLYFKWQANPIGVPVLISYFESIFKFLPLTEESLARLPAVLLILPCFYLVRKIYQEFFGESSMWSSIFFVFVVFTHPSIWTYLGKIYSDSYYILVSISICCLYFSYKLNPNRKIFMGLCLILFLSIFVKLNAIMFMPLLGIDLALDYFRQKKFLKSIVKDRRVFFILSSLAGVLCYLGLAVYFDFPFRQNNSALLQLSLDEMFRNFILYNLHYFLVIAPFTLASLYQLFHRAKSREIKLAFVSSVVIWTFFFIFFRQNTLFNTGELNFGSFVDSILVRYYFFLAPVFLFLSLIFLALASLRVFAIVRQKESRTFLQDLEVGLVLFLIGLMLLHSFVKPVQRYLLVFILLHLFYFALLYHAKLKEKMAVVFGFFFGIYLLVSLALSLESQTRSDAYLKLGKIISSSGKYTLRIENDDLKGNLFGNVDEKFLIQKDSQKELCVFHSGYAEASAAAQAAPIQILEESRLRQQSFRISVGECL